MIYWIRWQLPTTIGGHTVGLRQRRYGVKIPTEAETPGELWLHDSHSPADRGLGF